MFAGITNTLFLLTGRAASSQAPSVLCRAAANLPAIAYADTNPEAYRLQVILFFVAIAMVLILGVSIAIIARNYIRLRQTQKSLHTAEEMLEKERALISAERRMTLAVEASKAGIWEYRYDRKLMYFDGRVGELYGMSMPSPVSIDEFNRHMDRNVRNFNPIFFSARIEKAANDGIQRVTDCVVFGGEVKYVSNSYRAEYNCCGELICVIGMATDITELEKARRAAEDSLVKLEAVMDNMQGVVWFVDTARLVTVFGGTSVWGITRERALGKPVGDVYPNVPTLAEAVENAFSTGEQQRFYLNLAEGIYEDCLVTPVKDRNGETVGVIGLEVDTSELHCAQEKLQRAIVIADDAARAKTDFLSRMSHGIRTPMNAVIGMAKIGMTSHALEKKQYCLEKVSVAAQNLLELLNQILDMSKIEANKMELSTADFDMEKLLSEVCSAIGMRADEKKQHLSVTFDSNFDRMFVGDRQRLSQVITNLLSNAVKFTPDGGHINVTIHENKRLEEVSQIQISVADSGIGIPPDRQARLFTPFEQGDGDIARQFGGTGLGLAIAKNIIIMMGGDIWVDSEPGIGTTFTFTVMLRRSARPSAYVSLDPGIDKATLRVLVCDAAEDVRSYFTHIMASYGIVCDTADCGETAASAIRAASGEGRPYSIAFVAGQELADGGDAIRRIEELLGQSAVVTMMPAVEWAARGDPAMPVARHALQKPLFPSAIFKVLNTVLCSGNDAEEQQQAAAHDFSGKTILLVEDIDVNREIVITYLEDTHVGIETAENGRQALAMFSGEPDKYDLILMDVHMPNMDGYEATMRIRALRHERALRVPIIAMTANVLKDDVDKCFAVGMDDHVGKPVDMSDLLAKIEKYINGTSRSFRAGV